MKLASHILQRALRLGRPPTRDLVVQHDLQVPMPDGAVLLADRWIPRTGGGGLPVALLRSPYGRRSMQVQVLAMARPLAERGFQVLLQGTRGTFGCGGTFDPLRQEREDGLSLETPFQCGVMTSQQEQRGATLRALLTGGRRRRRALATLPLGQSDLVAVGRRVDYIQDILSHDRTARRWAGVDHRHCLADVTVPVSSISGWYDVFLPSQLQDFTISRRPAAHIG